MIPPKLPRLQFLRRLVILAILGTLLEILRALSRGCDAASDTLSGLADRLIAWGTRITSDFKPNV